MCLPSSPMLDVCAVIIPCISISHPMLQLSVAIHVTAHLRALSTGPPAESSQNTFRIRHTRMVHALWPCAVTRYIPDITQDLLQ